MRAIRASPAPKRGKYETSVMATQTNPTLLRHVLSKRPDALTDAHALEDAIHRHSAILDRLSNEMMTIKNSDSNAKASRAELWKLCSLAEYHRDVVDRLTDVAEQISERC